MANTPGEKELKRNWPVTSGLTAGTTKTEGRQINLTYEKSFVSQRDTKGL